MLFRDRIESLGLSLERLDILDLPPEKYFKINFEIVSYALILIVHLENSIVIR